MEKNATEPRSGLEGAVKQRTWTLTKILRTKRSWSWRSLTLAVAQCNKLMQIKQQIRWSNDPRSAETGSKVLQQLRVTAGARSVPKSCWHCTIQHPFWDIGDIGWYWHILHFLCRVQTCSNCAYGLVLLHRACLSSFWKSLSNKMLSACVWSTKLGQRPVFWLKSGKWAAEKWKRHKN